MIGKYCGVWSDSGTLNVYPGAVISGEYGIYASTAPKVYLYGGSITGTGNAIGKSSSGTGTITVAEGLDAYLDGTALTSPITGSTAAGTIIVGVWCTGEHTFDDAGLCTRCKLQAAAKVEKEDEAPIYVTSLTTAFTQGNSGATVTLLYNALITDTINIGDGNAFTLNLNNKSITMTKSSSAFCLRNGSLTVEGDGTIISEKNHGIWVQSGCTLTMNGGTVQTNGSHYHGIYVDGGTATVNSGAHIISQNNADQY